MGVPTPAAAIVVLLPVYLEHLGLDLRGNDWSMSLVIGYTILVGVMMVTIIPTYSGKLLGERISREWVLPLFILVITRRRLSRSPTPTARSPSATLALPGLYPLSWKRFRALEQQNSPAAAAAPRNAPVLRRRQSAEAASHGIRRSPSPAMATIHASSRYAPASRSAKAFPPSTDVARTGEPRCNARAHGSARPRETAATISELSWYCRTACARTAAGGPFGLSSA